MTFRKFFSRIAKFHGGWLAVALAIAFFIVTMAIPNYIPVRHRSKISACINNLRQIDGAKQNWALETKADSNAVPTWENILPYLGQGVTREIPQCPSGGHYTLGKVSFAPTCSIKGHSLDE